MSNTTLQLALISCCATLRYFFATEGPTLVMWEHSPLRWVKRNNLPPSNKSPVKRTTPLKRIREPYPSPPFRYRLFCQSEYPRLRGSNVW